MSKFLCDLPWVHFSIFPHGTTSVCCETEHKNALGHGFNGDHDSKNILGVKNNSINDIVNCDNYRKIRLDMLAGVVPEACAGCKKIEDAGGRSKRIKDSYWKEDWAKVTNPDGSIKPDLRSIELRLGNHCNLRCRSCNAESSTSWIKEYNQLKDKLPLASNYAQILKEPRYSFDWVDTDEFYDDLIQYTENLEELHISGGEPFLVPRHFKFLSKLVDIGKTDISIGYHTNLNYDIDKILPNLEILEKFKRVRFNCSLDDVGARNTYIRNPSNWKLSIDNLKRFNKEFTNIDLLVCQTINAYNFMYAEELYNYLLQNDIELYQYFNHVHSPDYQTAYIIPPAERKKKIDSMQHKVNDRLFTDFYGRYYNDMYYEHAVPIFKKFTSSLDASRQENYNDLFDKLTGII